jgi:hypothetical protein
MKKIVLSLWFAVSLLAVNAQNLVNDPRVVEYRKDLGHIDSLMQNGIMTEEVSGMDYFTGYAYKTLYDWDQYFESIVQVYMGWEPDYIKNGLSEWMSAPHTGMDNQHERAGFWHDRNCEGVDLNCYLVRETRAFARLAKSLWEGAGTNSHSAGQWKIPVRYVGAFAPLWAGVASEEQAESMVMNYLTNPREFWAPYPLATLSKSEPWYSTTLLPSDNGCSWRANTWIPSGDGAFWVTSLCWKKNYFFNGVLLMFNFVNPNKNKSAYIFS